MPQMRARGRCLHCRHQGRCAGRAVGPAQEAQGNRTKSFLPAVPPAPSADRGKHWKAQIYFHRAEIEGEFGAEKPQFSHGHMASLFCSICKCKVKFVIQCFKLSDTVLKIVCAKI